MLRRQKHALSQSTTPFACTLQKSTVGGSPGPKIGNFCKNWQFLQKFVGSEFLLEIQFWAIFGQYSFQQYFVGSLLVALNRRF